MTIFTKGTLSYCRKNRKDHWEKVAVLLLQVYMLRMEQAKEVMQTKRYWGQLL